MEHLLRVDEGVHNGLHRLLQVLHGTLLGSDDLLPVPLIHVGRVQLVQILIPADGVHIGIQTDAGAELIALQSQTLPLGQRVNHLGGSLHAVDVKGHGALHAVQVVVQSGSGGDEQGCGHAVQMERAGQFVLKQALEQADSLLSLVNRKQRGIALRKFDLTHLVDLLTGVEM